MTTTATAGTLARRRHGPAAAVRDARVVMRRNLLRYVRQPQIAVFVVIQPVMFVLLFRFVFGGAIAVPGLDYVQFLIPGIIAQSVTFNTVGTSIGIAEDLKGGIIDRFRSLPMSHSAVLAGRVLSDSMVMLVTVFVMGSVGYLVGFRISTSVWETLAAVALLVVFGFSFSWIAASIGLALREPEAVQSAGFIWLFPLNFASSVFVPPQSMPSWLQGFANDVNPITHVANATRALTVGGYTCDQGLCTDVTSSLLWVLGWCALILVVFIPLAARGWQRLS